MRPTRSPRELLLVAVGEVDPGLLRWIGPELDRRFGTVSRVGPRFGLREEWRGGRTAQYCSNPIVDALLEEVAGGCDDPGGRWVLGVTEADLYAPDRKWVFGEATVGGCCALISTARLAGPDAAGTSILRKRMLAEAVHELGHVVGLMHCSDRGCVMFESYDVPETDRKGCDFCAACSVRGREVVAGGGLDPS